VIKKQEELYKVDFVYVPNLKVFMMTGIQLNVKHVILNVFLVKDLLKKNVLNVMILGFYL